MMTKAGIAFGCELILSMKRGKSCTLYLIRQTGTDSMWPCTSLPVGRTAFVTVGTYTADITLAELRLDMHDAARRFFAGERDGLGIAA